MVRCAVIALHADTAGRPRVCTTVGSPPGPAPYMPPEQRCAAIRHQLERGPFLAGFNAVGHLRDIAGELDRAHLMLVLDDELLDAIDRDAGLVRRVP